MHNPFHGLSSFFFAPARNFYLRFGKIQSYMVPPFEEKKEFPRNFSKKEFPRNLKKVFPPKLTVQQ